MVAVKLEGLETARRDAMKSIDDLERRFAQNLHALVEDVDRHIKSVTPVNTGQAVRNYIWTRGSPNSTVFDAIDNGPPGPTNSMTLGDEPRRAPNEAAAARSLSTLGLLNDPFGVIYLTNLAPNIQGLEAGSLPGPPLRSRSPNGMFGITEQFANVKIRAKGLLR